jgi:hypothetical protein
MGPAHPVPDAVQRFFSAAPQSRDPQGFAESRWTPDQQRITPQARRAAQHPGNAGPQPPCPGRGAALLQRCSAEPGPTRFRREPMGPGSAAHHAARAARRAASGERRPERIVSRTRCSASSALLRRAGTHNNSAAADGPRISSASRRKRGAPRSIRGTPARNHRVPDAVQRFFSAAPQSRDPQAFGSGRWAPDQQRITPQARRAAKHPGNVAARPRPPKRRPASRGPWQDR